MKILLIGSGGREHALAWKLKQSPKCEALYCAPGNAGIAKIAECVPIGVDDIVGLVRFAKDTQVDFVVVGPEGPLVAGVVDALDKAGIPAFGPRANAAILEGSKGFTKDLCAKYNIPTAGYGRFTEADSAKEFAVKQSIPVVVKADGLAAGKGVIIAQSHDEANAAIDDMLSGNAFGEAGASVVIEEFMDGEELSFFALSDGKSVVPLISAQDHKRVGDGDTGPNTGGMGAYAPAHMMTQALHNTVMDTIIKPTVDGMAAEGRPFTGVLYAGLIIEGGIPKLIEYNARFGDPECQVIMPLLQSDLVDLLYACATGTLDALPALQWRDDKALCVVMAANGYPGSYAKNTMIEALPDDGADTMVFHAGTARDETGNVVSIGGRVLNVVAFGPTIKEAQKKAYHMVDGVKWPDGFCRRDIGWRAISA